MVFSVPLNPDEEVGSLASAGLIEQAARGKHAALTYEPSALPDGTMAGARPGSGNFSFTVRGKAAHSSAPEQALSAIEGARQVLGRLKNVPLAGRHPLLGQRHALAYQLTFEPMAPHTLPEVARLRETVNFLCAELGLSPPGQPK